MKSARELMQTYLDNFHHDTSVSLDVFAEEGVIEFPYLKSIGMPERYSGKKNIGELLVNLKKTIPDFKFQNIIIYNGATPDEAFAEYSVDAMVPSLGRVYKQHYAARIVSKNGKIIILREFLDTIAVAKALLPAGLNDI
ncbi:PhzA/PhzB family protein [Bacteriovorax sp. PP10]|uniref:PhzA/PhzB family protein n=1 Tax=Bacteriovorax antarcticus TaxID=3088717 RepID=A0ABU5W1N2_9BACT|nr:PhzA/PhzB family protein [Bacteriovorax sp. PP10]MEA9358439.1 PhzA/PhzB family protein [Bacteriovorax sp. PP10]